MEPSVQQRTGAHPEIGCALAYAPVKNALQRNSAYHCALLTKLGSERSFAQQMGFLTVSTYAHYSMFSFCVRKVFACTSMCLKLSNCKAAIAASKSNSAISDISAFKKTSNTSNIQKMFVREAYKPSSVIGGHLSRPIVTNGFKRNPESLTGRLKRSFVSCCEWGLHRGRVARPRVSSYLTFPPLHMFCNICGISLLHFPWGRPRRALPGTLPYAARTFLTPSGARPPGSLTNGRIISYF